MQVITSLMEESGLSLSIVKIEVEKLFGKYTYVLNNDNNSLNSSLILLYGNNGSGKTTILKLLFHLLSPSNSKKHRKFLLKTPFVKFSVFLANGTSITAVRKGGALVGSFEIKLVTHNHSIIENIIVEDAKDTLINQENNFKRYLSELQLSLFFLGDDRNLDSDVFEDKEDIDQNDNIGISVYTQILLSKLQEDKAINRDIALKESIRRTEEWMREQALKGANQGAENAQTIYEDIISGIILSDKVAKNKSSYISDNLIEQLEAYEQKSQDFSRFGLMLPLSTKKIVNVLKSHPEANHSIIPNILTPYIDGIEGRFDALKETYNILSLFEQTINKLFFNDKYIRLHVQNGIKIFTDQREELSSELLSSGEKQLLLLFCNTLTARNKATIFIIDEPEISLNIKWQRQLIRALLELTKGSQVQFILATHSIELLSQYNNYVIRLQATGE
jgi:energy-coupling factor transporter ATP-binding protein EcfA2